MADFHTAILTACLIGQLRPARSWFNFDFWHLTLWKFAHGSMYITGAYVVLHYLRNGN